MLFKIPHGVVFKGKDRQYYEATKHGRWKRITLQSDVVSDKLMYIGQPSVWTKEKPNQWSPFPRGMMAGSYAIEFHLSKHFHTIKEANDYILSVHKKWTPGLAVKVGKNKVVIGGLCAERLLHESARRPQPFSERGRFRTRLLSHCVSKVCLSNPDFSRNIDTSTNMSP